MIHLSRENTTEIIKHLRAGAVVALPTETVYGLAISLNSEKALEKLIFLKRRDLGSGKVFTLVPESKSAIESYAHLSYKSSLTINRYLPGEITLILPKNPNFSHPYYDHFLSIGIRIPDHPLFQTILKETGPLLLTSANPRGDTPALDSKTVEKTLPKVDVIVDGTAGGHLPSTIVSFMDRSPEIIRQGDLKVDLTFKKPSHKKPLKK